MRIIMFPRPVRALCAAVMLAATAACTLQEQRAPAMTGPSEFGLSVTLSATPDQLPRNGRAQSLVTATVRNASGQPVSGQRLSVAASLGAVSQDEIVTGSDGRASFTFTAPSAGSIGNFAEVQVIPVGDNANNAVGRSLSILLTGVSNAEAPTPDFTTIGDLEVGAAIRFDASSTQDEGVPCLDACSYFWDFGDAGTAAGRRVSHTYSIARNYTVTLVVRDSAGTSASVTRVISVAAVAAPTVEIRVTPTQPFVNTPTVFLATATAAPGHSIQRYEWNFGDGTAATTTLPSIAKIYTAIGTYVVTATAVDDLGRTGTVAQTVVVTHSVTPPAAVLTASPSSPAVGAQVTFDGSSSTVGAGATITKYVWNLGDGSSPIDTGTVPTVVAVYGSAGTFPVTLTITDSLGRQDTAVIALTVVP